MEGDTLQYLDKYFTPKERKAVMNKGKGIKPYGKCVISDFIMTHVS